MRAKNWQKPLPWLVVAALLVLWEVCVRAFDVPLYVLPLSLIHISEPTRH